MTERAARAVQRMTATAVSGKKGDAKIEENVYQPVWEQQGLPPDTMVW